MDFELAKDQEMIKKSAREFFEKECPKEKVRELKEDPIGYDPGMWKKMVKLGFPGLAIPEEYRGTEGEFLDLMILMEEIGRNIVPSPFYSTVVLCSIPMVEFGTEKQKKKFLPGIAEKGSVWAFAHTEQMADYKASDIRLSAKRKGDGFTLDGTKLFVPYANSADNFLVTARTTESENPEEGVTLFLVDAKSEGINI